MFVVEQYLYYNCCVGSVVVQSSCAGVMCNGIIVVTCACVVVELSECYTHLWCCLSVFTQMTLNSSLTPLATSSCPDATLLEDAVRRTTTTLTVKRTDCSTSRIQRMGELRSVDARD